MILFESSFDVLIINMSYDLVSVMELRDLMDHRGQDAILNLKDQFGEVQHLCDALHTSTNEGLF